MSHFLLLIVIHEPRLQLLPHLLETGSCATHLAAPVVIFLHLLYCKPELFGNISYALINYVKIGDRLKGLKVQINLIAFTFWLRFLGHILRRGRYWLAMGRVISYYSF